jgi:tetratricopeptide (TPR) repeat protein
LQEAASQLDRLGAKPNLTGEERFRIAWLYGKAKQYPQAIVMFQSINSSFPDIVGRDYGLALAYYENGQNAEAIKLLVALRERGIDRAEIYNLLGAAEEATGQPEIAYDAFRSGIERFPDDESSYLNAATVAVQYHQYSAAEQIMTLGLKRIPSNYKLFLIRGVIYTLWGDLDKAEADYRHSVSLAPNESSTHVALGICYMDKHQDAEAVEVFHQAIHSGLEDVRLYYYLVDELFNQDITKTATFQEAIDAVNASIRFEPQFAYSYFQRGRLMLLKGQLESAIADFEHARSLEPDSKDTAITYQLAIAYRDAGRKTEATRLLSDISAAVKKQDDGYRYGTLVSVIGEESGSGFNEH